MFLREKAILHLHRRGIRLIEQEIGVTEMNLTEKEFVKFLSKFDEHPFDVKIGDEVSHIGKGESEFTVIFHKIPSMKELLTSTSIALGEAYMDGKLEIEGDLYHALNMFLGQMGKFSTDKKALKKLIFSSLTKKNQQKEVSSHYDIGNDFYKLWLDDTLSYSCAYFKNENESLGEAQLNKIHHLLKKLKKNSRIKPFGFTAVMIGRT